MTPLYFASYDEQHAVSWFKRSHGRDWRVRALTEVAYSRSKHYDWTGRPIPRATLVMWRACPYGAPDLNRMHQLATRCIRRNTHFRSIAKKLGRKHWPHPWETAP